MCKEIAVVSLLVKREGIAMLQVRIVNNKFVFLRNAEMINLTFSYIFYFYKNDIVFLKNLLV